MSSNGMRMTPRRVARLLAVVAVGGLAATWAGADVGLLGRDKALDGPVAALLGEGDSDSAAALCGARDAAGAALRELSVLWVAADGRTRPACGAPLASPSAVLAAGWRPGFPAAHRALAGKPAENDSDVLLIVWAVDGPVDDREAERIRRSGLPPPPTRADVVRDLAALGPPPRLLFASPPAYRGLPLPGGPPPLPFPPSAALAVGRRNWTVPGGLACGLGSPADDRSRPWLLSLVSRGSSAKNLRFVRLGGEPSNGYAEATGAEYDDGAGPQRTAMCDVAVWAGVGTPAVVRNALALGVPVVALADRAAAPLPGLVAVDADPADMEGAARALLAKAVALLDDPDVLASLSVDALAHAHGTTAGDFATALSSLVASARNAPRPSPPPTLPPAPIAEPPAMVDLAFCTIVRNEDDALEEWLSYHLAQGAGLFHLYHLDDHDARDRWREVLWPFVARGVVRMRAKRLRYAGQLANRQSASLKACLRELSGRARWIAFLDVDEFLVPPAGRTVVEELARFADKPGLFVPWRTLGPGPDASEHDPEHLPLHRVLHAASDTGADPLNLLGRGKLLLRAAHPGAARACEHFMNFNPGMPSYLWMDHAHNCLAGSGVLPVDTLGREAGDSRVPPHPIPKDGLKAFHYFARSCAGFEAKRLTRLNYYRATHGKDPDPGGWFRGRTGEELGNTTAERCAAMRRHFTEEERGAVAHLHLLERERAAGRAARVPALPPRKDCGGCDGRATCVDLLGGARCVCGAAYEGDGRFCGKVAWADGVHPKIGYWERASVRGGEGTLHVPPGEGRNGTAVIGFAEAGKARAVRVYLQDGACGVAGVAISDKAAGNEWRELAVPRCAKGAAEGEIEVKVRLPEPASVARVRVKVRPGSTLAATGLLVEA